MHLISGLRKTLLMGFGHVIVKTAVNFLISFVFLPGFLRVDELVDNVLLDEHHDTAEGLRLHTEEPIGWFGQHYGWLGDFVRVAGDEVLLQVAVFGDSEQDDPLHECKWGQLQVVLHWSTSTCTKQLASGFWKYMSMTSSLWENLAKNLAFRCGEGNAKLVLLHVVHRHARSIRVTSSMWSSLKKMDRDSALNSDFYGLLTELRTRVRLFELSSWSSVFNYFCIGCEDNLIFIMLKKLINHDLFTSKTYSPRWAVVNMNCDFLGLKSSEKHPSLTPKIYDSITCSPLLPKSL